MQKLQKNNKKLTLTFLAALLLAPLTVFAEENPEVVNTTTAAKREWESAPADKKALWQQQCTVATGGGLETPMPINH